MRTSLAIASALSLVVHVGLGAALAWPRKNVDALPPTPTMAGETFELPAPETADAPLANASPSPNEMAAPSPIDAPEESARPTPPARAHLATRPSHQGRASGGRTDPGTPEGATGGTSTSSQYGAVGDRSASDLATAFIRNFSLASSADPLWASAAMGGAGDATLALTLDESGHITDAQVSGSPSKALRSGIDRTMALIKTRPFVAKGKITKLHMVATINPDASTAFGVGPGGSEDKKAGTSWFRLTNGRRVDLSVQVK